MTMTMIVSPRAGRLGLERPIELHGGIDGQDGAGEDAAVVGDEGDVAVGVDHVDRLAFEVVAVLAEDISFRPFADDGIGGKDEDVADGLDRDLELDALAGAEAPQAVSLVAALVEAEGLVIRIDAVGEMGDFKIRLEGGPELVGTEGVGPWGKRRLGAARGEIGAEGPTMPGRFLGTGGPRSIMAFPPTARCGF